MERIAPVPRDQRLHFRTEKASRAGRVVLRLTHLQVAHPGNPNCAIVGAPRELELERGGRIAIIGANGAGKTTLLRTVMGELPPLAGETRFGANVTPAFFRQASEDLDPDDTVLDA